MSEQNPENIEYIFKRNFLSEKNPEENGNYFLKYYSFALPSSTLNDNHMEFSKEIGKLYSESIIETAPIKHKDPLVENVTNTKESEISRKKEKTEENQKKKRERNKRKDNIYSKIKRRIFNSYLFDILEKLRRRFKLKLYFIKFPTSFVINVNKAINKKCLNLTIRDIITTKGFYKTKNELENYNFNLKVIISKEIEENEEFQKILNMTYQELIEEYMNSDEIKNGEINFLKERGFDDEYINLYKECAKGLISFFNE